MLTFTLPLSAAPPKPEPYILLVDDHPQALRSLQAVVKQAGFACTTVGSATGAVQYCDMRRPQVVVTDLSMPNLDGCGLARWLKERYPSVPLVLVTGEPLGSAELSRLRLLFTAVFSKPLAVSPFLDCLERLMPAVDDTEESGSPP